MSRARVLIVDDSASARRKLALAVTALGHATREVASGEEALTALQAEPFDLMLLDVVMPGMDGFDVLRVVREDESLREVPVIVVSGLENEPGAVIDAIRLGAVDFLPKAFESVLLRARIGAALRRKRNRDSERRTLLDIQRLGEAAALLETSLVTGERLDIDDIAARGDALGRFATTFRRMAVRVHERECGLRRRLAIRRGLALLIVSGVLFGLTTPLSKIAVTAAPHPMGLSLWANALTAGLCLIITAWRRRWPPRTRPVIRFAIAWGLIGAALSEVMLFSVAERVPASTLSVIIVLESFMVFAYSALAGQERAEMKRLAGLFVGLVAVLILMQSHTSGSAADDPMLWILIALSVPACYAFEDVLIAMRLPPNVDLIAIIGLAALVAVVALAPLVFLFDEAVAIRRVPSIVPLVLIVMVSVTTLGTVLHTRLVANAGAVFGSQASYVITLAGIVWAMLLLDEQLASGIWAALALMFLGLLLVEPKREPDDVLDIGVFETAR